MSGYHHPDEDFFRKLDVPLPEAHPHGSDDEIRANMNRLLPNSWKLEGDQLKGMTSMGELVQKIPTDYILTGVDKNGMPTFKKVII